MTPNRRIFEIPLSLERESCTMALKLPIGTERCYHPKSRCAAERKREEKGAFERRKVTVSLSCTGHYRVSLSKETERSIIKTWTHFHIEG